MFLLSAIVDYFGGSVSHVRDIRTYPGVGASNRWGVRPLRGISGGYHALVRGQDSNHDHSGGTMGDGGAVHEDTVGSQSRCGNMGRLDGGSVGHD